MTLLKSNMIKKIIFRTNIIISIMLFKRIFINNNDKFIKKKFLKKQALRSTFYLIKLNKID